jgi:hypothetical protein
MEFQGDMSQLPLYETLDASFPPGLMPQGLEHRIKWMVRRKLRDIGYRVNFPEGEEWQAVVEAFTLAGLDRMHRSFGVNPWFWVVAWPAVFGAAAADFWPEIATADELRCVAAQVCAAHLEAIMLKRALSDIDAAKFYLSFCLIYCIQCIHADHAHR